MHSGVKRLENQGQLLARNALAVVSDLKEDRVVFPVVLNVHVNWLCAEAEGIGDQVEDYLLQPLLLRRDHRRHLVAPLYVELDLLPLGLDPETLQNLHERVVQVEGGTVWLEVRAQKLLKVREVIDLGLHYSDTGFDQL